MGTKRQKLGAKLSIYFFIDSGRRRGKVCISLAQQGEVIAVLGDSSDRVAKLPVGLYSSCNGVADGRRLYER